jgi:hypothetical protein
VSGEADGFVGYPMVEEVDATGAVAAVYADLLESMQFVPSLFKSLALCPGYLVLAAEQASSALPDPAFGSAAQQLVASVRDVATPPADAEVRQALAGFAGPLSRMLLLAAGLRLALDGELDVPPAPGRLPAARPVEPESPAPSPADAPAPRRYGEIRAALDTRSSTASGARWADGGCSTLPGRSSAPRSPPPGRSPMASRTGRSPPHDRCPGRWPGRWPPPRRRSTG